MNISLKSILLPATVVLLALSSCGKKQSIRLVTEDVTKGSISETVTATGTLESVTSVDVGTQVTGIIDNILVDFNSEVKKGQLIAEIDKVLLQSELTSAEANVKSAKASYDYARTNYERDKALHEKKLISDYEFDTTRRDYEVAKTSYDKSVADRVRAAKNLTYAEIYSPIDGIVISRDVEVGQTVVSNMTVANLFTIADLDNMRVVANVDEADIGRVKEGQQVTFTVDAYPDQVFHGTVTQKRISPTTESNVVTYEVLVSADNEDHKLIPGLTANLTIYSGNLYIEVGDTTGFIRKVSMKIPRTVNLNFIDNLRIEQLYEKDDAGRRHKVSDRLNMDICLVKGSQRFSAARTSRFENFTDSLRSDLKDAWMEDLTMFMTVPG